MLTLYVSGEGIEPDPKKVQAVAQWLTPQSVTEVRAFVALASYYRQHIRSFAEIARPLHELTKKNTRFSSGSPQERAFHALKEALTNAPVLAMPIDGGGYVLDTDANNFSMGCVLQQWQNGELKVIGYASKAFSDSELRYCTTRTELTAVIFGLKYYRHFLLGYDFVLHTDHVALTHLRMTPHPVAQLERYLDTLAEYKFTVQYRPGESHKNADALSRHPCNRKLDSPLCKQCGPLLDPIDETGEEESETQVSPDNLENEVRRVDEEIGVVGTTLRAEAPVFLPQVKYEETAEESKGREAGTISGEVDQRIGTADEMGPSVSSLTPEGISYELFARLTKATPRKGQNGFTAGTEATTSVSKVVSVERLREEQRKDVELKEVIKWIENPESVPGLDKLRTYSPEIQQLWAQHQSLHMRSGILYRKFIKPDGALQYCAEKFKNGFLRCSAFWIDEWSSRD